jgi:hypothetical protein
MAEKIFSITKTIVKIVRCANLLIINQMAIAFDYCL